MRIRTLAIASAAFAAAAATAVTAIATPAQASQAPEKPVHCVGNLTASTTTVSCYDSFTVAIAKATGGRVTDAPEKAETALDNPAFKAKMNGPSHALNRTRDTSGKTPAVVTADVGVQATFVVEIDFDYSFWGTSTITWTAPQDCFSNPFGVVKYQVPDLTVYGWNDRINAFDNYSYCYTKHFEHIWFQGAYVGWQYGNHNLGVLDGEISSIQWT